MIDALIVGAVVASAVGYIVWRALPRRRPAACAGCAVKR